MKAKKRRAPNSTGRGEAKFIPEFKTQAEFNANVLTPTPEQLRRIAGHRTAVKPRAQLPSDTINTREAAELLGMSVEALERIRESDRALIAAKRPIEGPRWFITRRYGAWRIYYLQPEVIAWRASSPLFAAHKWRPSDGLSAKETAALLGTTEKALAHRRARERARWRFDQDRRYYHGPAWYLVEFSGRARVVYWKDSVLGWRPSLIQKS